MTKVIFVPIVYQGRELKAPFLLFVDWTVEQRKRYANDLRELKKAKESMATCNWKPTLIVAAGDSARKGLISRESNLTLAETVSSGDQIVFRFETTLEDLWLDMQIGMVDVPTFEF